MLKQNRELHQLVRYEHIAANQRCEANVPCRLRDPTLSSFVPLHTVGKSTGYSNHRRWIPKDAIKIQRYNINYLMKCANRNGYFIT